MSADNFAARLKELREQAGLTQKQLAEKAGLSQQGIGHWEKGLRDPSWQNVVALCQALGVSCEEFMTEPTEKREAKPGRPPKATPATPPAADLEKTAKGRRGKK